MDKIPGKAEKDIPAYTQPEWVIPEGWPRIHRLKLRLESSFVTSILSNEKPCPKNESNAL